MSCRIYITSPSIQLSSVINDSTIRGPRKRRSRERGPRKRKVVKRKRVQHGRRIVLRIHLRNLSGEDNEGLRKGDDVTRGFIMK